MLERLLKECKPCPRNCVPCYRDAHLYYTGLGCGEETTIAKEFVRNLFNKIKKIIF